MTVDERLIQIQENIYHGGTVSDDDIVWMINVIDSHRKSMKGVETIYKIELMRNGLSGGMLMVNENMEKELNKTFENLYENL